MLEAFGWGAITAVSLLIGSLVALKWKLPNRIVGWFMAFGAGALISAISFDLFEETALADTMIPEAFEESGKLAGLLTVLGFSVAVLISALD